MHIILFKLHLSLYLFAVSGHRYGGGQCIAVHGNDDAAAGHDLAAVQADRVRAGRRMESYYDAAGEKFPIIIVGFCMRQPGGER